MKLFFKKLTCPYIKQSQKHSKERLHDNTLVISCVNDTA